MMELVKYDEEFCQKSFEWLQDDELCSLVDTAKPTKASQTAWFNSILYRNDYLIWGIKFDDIPIGVCGIKHISSSSGEYFGYFGEKKHRGKGLGEQMMRLVEKEARNKNLNLLYLHVLPDNKRAIALYEKSGYHFDRFERGGLIYIKEL